MRISDWSSDVCSSDLAAAGDEADPESRRTRHAGAAAAAGTRNRRWRVQGLSRSEPEDASRLRRRRARQTCLVCRRNLQRCRYPDELWRSEEHTSELQSLMRISYAVFCLKKKKRIQ